MVILVVGGLLLARTLNRDAALTPEQARSAAARACEQVRLVEQLVGANADTDQVFAALEIAEREAGAAAEGDPRWLGLSGGVQSLAIAFRADDPRVARTGIDVVRAECSRLGQ